MCVQAYCKVALAGFLKLVTVRYSKNALQVCSTRPNMCVEISRTCIEYASGLTFFASFQYYTLYHLVYFNTVSSLLSTVKKPTVGNGRLFNGKDHINAG